MSADYETFRVLSPQPTVVLLLESLYELAVLHGSVRYRAIVFFSPSILRRKLPECNNLLR